MTQSSSHSCQAPENWFASWFDTPYYHILYKDRDFTEGQVLIDNLTAYLNLDEKAKVLDLACGKGRHARYLNELGYEVTGADLSENSIAEASAFENPTLHFVRHDMRQPFDEKFEAIFNLFTSFGYFDSDEDEQKTLESISASLTETGLAVIDFMNVPYVLEHLVPTEVKTVDGIDFHITRCHQDGFIFKDIRFQDKGHAFHFTEKVRALTLTDFETLMERSGLFLLDVFGDYKLRKFHPAFSERLIMVFR